MNDQRQHLMQPSQKLRNFPSLDEYTRERVSTRVQVTLTHRLGLPGPVRCGGWWVLVSEQEPIGSVFDSSSSLVGVIHVE